MNDKTVKTLVAVLMIFLAANIFVGAYVPSAKSETSLPDYQPFDAGPRVRKGNLNVISEGALEPRSHHSYWNVGDIAYWLLLDDYAGVYRLARFQLRAIGTTAEIWVQVDLAWPAGDPRSTPTILDSEVAYMLSEFENNIYPTDTAYFGTPAFHDGSNALLDNMLGLPADYWQDTTGRNVILVSNIRDENYYDYTYPYYIAGFYSSSFEYYFDRNIISIDSYAWERRLGSEGTEWIPGIYVNRPYVYEATVAHEYQHLIHDDYNPDDPSFMNEGAAMYAEILCGYPVDWGYVNSFLYTPDNSLTEWGDQGDINILADYGAAMLWAIYLSDHFGGAAFMSYFVQAGVPGIAGINAALAHFGYTETFDDVYKDWTIANLIHTNQIGGGKYNYVTLDIGSPDAIAARTYEIKTPQVKPTRSADFGWTYTILGYNTLTYKLPEYGSDYVKFTGLNELLRPIFNFDGQDRAGASWKLADVDGDGDLEWFSTSAINLADISIQTEVDLTGMATATLTFDTLVNTELLWDYGFVQVSTDGGATWTSLSGTYTTTDHDPSAHSNIIANLPGYTGDSGGWISDSMSLTPYVGGKILLQFRYMTDWATLLPGWAVDNIAINGAIIDNGDTVVSFYPFPPMPEVDWKVTLIGVEIDYNMPKYKVIETLALNDLTETGSRELEPFIEYGYVLLIMSPDKGWSDYSFSVTRGTSNRITSTISRVSE